MTHRSRPVRVRADICQRLKRINRGARAPVQELVNAILRDFVDEVTLTHRCSGKNSQRPLWRRR
jgi:hypothetical protein